MALIRNPIMAHVFELSKASDVLSIRRNDRRHSIDLVCQVLRTSGPEFKNFKFLACEVVSDENPSIRRCFSLKVWQKEKAMVEDVVVTDIIRIRKAWKKDASRRNSTNYVMLPTDLDVEFHSPANLEVEILFSSLLSDVKNFSFLRAARTAVTIRGRVDRLPEQEGEDWVLMLADELGNVVEARLKECAELKTGDFCKVFGDVVKEDGLLIMRATECLKMNSLDEEINPVEETPPSTTEDEANGGSVRLPSDDPLGLKQTPHVVAVRGTNNNLPNKENVGHSAGLA